MRQRHAPQRTELGQRLLQLRQNARLSQTQLAAAVGLPQRTIANYETIANYVPSSVLPRLAAALDVTIEEVIGVPVSATAARRGRRSKLDRQFERLRQLPQSDQEFAAQLLDRLLAAAK